MDRQAADEVVKCVITGLDDSQIVWEKPKSKMMAVRIIRMMKALKLLLLSN